MKKQLTIGSLKPGRTTFYQTLEKSPAPSEPVKNWIEIEQHQSRFQVKTAQNKTLLDTALNQNINLDFKCRKGTCGKCRVKVLEGGSLLCPVNDAEQKKLGEEIDDGYRLSCQAVFQ